MNHKRKNNIPKGGALLELLMALGVGTIILLALTGFSFVTAASHQQTQARITHSRELQLIALRLDHLIASAYAIDPLSDVDSDLATTNGKISLLSQQVESPISIYVENGTLMMQTGAGTPLPLHAPSVRVSTMIAQNVSQPDEQLPQLRMTITLRSSLAFGAPDTFSTLTKTYHLLDYAP